VVDDEMVSVRLTDPPSKPGRPEIVDYDADVAEIHWTPSLHDGGSPVQKYVVEMREVPNHSWHSVRHSSGLAMAFIRI